MRAPELSLLSLVLSCVGCQSVLGVSDDGPKVSGSYADGAPLISSSMLPAEGYAAADGGAATQGPELRCTADDTRSQKTDYSAPGPFSVGKLDMTFEDTSRPIPAADGRAAAPSRRLVTTVYYPSGGRRLFGAESLAAGGPFPLLMYSHGFSSSRSEAGPVGEHAASHGFIVVAPDFPLSNLLANNGAPDGSDAHNQAGDLSFLIDRMIAFSRDSNHMFANAVDESRIGATGVSMGGFTTLIATFHPTLHDPRIKVAAPMAPLTALFMEGFYHTRDVPVLFIHGDTDAFIKYADTRRAFERSQPNSRLVTLTKGTHAAFAIQLDQATVALLNAALAPQGAHPTNPDGFGCGAVQQSIADSASPGTGLGGPENFVDLAIASNVRACAGDEYRELSMDAAEQVKIAAAAVVAMFDAHLATSPEQRSDGCRYLLHELPKHPSVTLE